MKILFVINTLAPGGKERRLTELMKALRSNPGVEFALVVMSHDIHYKEVLDLNIKMHYIIRRKKRDFSVFPRLYKICKNFHPDILHCWDSMTAIYAIPTCKLLHIKLVNGMVANTPEKRKIFNKNYFRAKLTFPFSNIIIGNSKAGLAAYKAPKKKSICIYNGFNAERLNGVVNNGFVREQLRIETKYIIGMVASFSKLKDYDTYFKAAQLILQKRKDITFLAIGKDTDSGAARKLIQGEYINFFRLLGRRSNIESLVCSMDVCALSTFTEGISNSILEYMALRKPVVATDGGGTKEIVIDRETGFLVKRSNPDEFSKKLEILLNDCELRTKMGEAGSQRVREHFSIDKMVNQYISVYKSLFN